MKKLSHVISHVVALLSSGRIQLVLKNRNNTSVLRPLLEGGSPNIFKRNDAILGYFNPKNQTLSANFDQTGHSGPNFPLRMHLAL